MANRTKRTPEKEETFLKELRTGKSVTAACACAGLGRQTVYGWRDGDDDFRQRWNDAVEEGTDRMEDEALRRAVDGTAKPVFHAGKPVGHVTEYSDTLMIFMLKARRPEKFKDRQYLEHTGKGGGPIETKEHSTRDVAKVLLELLGEANERHDDEPQPH